MTPASIVTALIALIMMQAVYANDFTTSCQRDFHNSDYENALTSCQQAAEKGDARSQTHLGELYAQGLAVEKNPQLASRWWRAAAMQNDTQARNLLAMKFYYGGDVFGPQPGWKQDYQSAFNLWQSGALLGDAASQFMLAVMYMQGQGAQQDYVESYAWFNIALEGGYKLATDTLIELSRLITPAQKKRGMARIAQLQKTIRHDGP